MSAPTVALQEEEQFDTVLRAYILNEGGRFAFGGIVNLLTTAAQIMAEASQIEDDAFEKAAAALDECAAACDLKYETPDALIDDVPDPCDVARDARLRAEEELDGDAHEELLIAEARAA
jgi:hypothetical protein